MTGETPVPPEVGRLSHICLHIRLHRGARATGRLLAALLFAVILVAALPARAADILRFDFQPEGAPLAEGFVQVTQTSLYAVERGHGWDGKAPAGAVLAALPDALTADALCGIASPFRIDVPDGEYDVYMWTGSFARTVPWPPASSFGVVVDGVRMTLGAVSAPRLWTDWLALGDVQPGAAADPWQAFVDRRLPQYRVRMKATGGALRVEFWGPVALSGMLVVPADRAKDGQKALMQIESARRAQFAEAFRAQPFPFADLAGTPDKASGIAIRLFDHAADPLDTAADTAAPEMLDAFAARGQTVTLGVLAIAARETAEILVTPDKLRDAKGAMLNAEIEVRWGRWCLDDRGRWRIGPLKRADAVKVQPGAPRLAWVLARVADDAPASVFTGTLAVRAGGKPAGSVAMRLRVLPFVLPPLKRLPGAPDVFAEYEPGADTAADANVIGDFGPDPFLVGLPPVVTGTPGDGKVSFASFLDAAKAWRSARADAAIGWHDFALLSGPTWPPERNLLAAALRFEPGTAGHLVALQRCLDDLATASKDLAPLYLAALDEPAAAAGKEAAARAGESLRMVASGKGVHAVVFPSNAAELSLATKDTLVAVGDRVAADYAVLSALGERKTPLLLAAPRPGRFGAGLFAWRCGARAVLCGTACRPEGAVLNPLDGDTAEIDALFMRTADGLAPMPAALHVRAGLDDLRTMLLLEQLAAASQSEKAKEARAFCEELRGRLPLSWDFFERNGMPPGAALDAIRQRAAELIVALHAQP